MKQLNYGKHRHDAELAQSSSVLLLRPIEQRRASFFNDLCDILPEASDATLRAQSTERATCAICGDVGVLAKNVKPIRRARSFLRKRQ